MLNSESKRTFAVAPHLMVLRDMPKNTRLEEHLFHVE